MNVPILLGSGQQSVYWFSVFLIEKFDLILAHLQYASGGGENIQGSGSAELAGLSLFCLGIALVVSASVRFFLYKKLIDEIEPQEYGVGAKKTSLVLVLLIMAHTVHYHAGIYN